MMDCIHSRQLRSQVSWTKEEVFDEGSPVIFCDFLKPGAEKRLYEESKEMGKMQQVMMSDSIPIPYVSIIACLLACVL